MMSNNTETELAQPAAKKRKQTEDKRPVLTKWVNEFTKRHPYYNREDMVAKISENPDKAYQLCVGTVALDFSRYTSLELPTYGLPIIFDRNEKNVIMGISDSETSLAPEVVQKIVSLRGAYKKGIYGLVLESKATGGYSAVLLPHVNLDKKTFKLPLAEAGAEPELMNGFAVHAQNTCHLVLPPADVTHIVGLDIVPIGNWPDLLKTLSELRMKDNEFDVTQFVSLESIATVDLDDAKGRHVNMVNSFQAAFLTTATLAEKVAAFEAKPSFDLLKRLKLGRPYTKQAYNQSGQGKEMVKLSSLGANNVIVFHDLAFDQGAFERLHPDMEVHTGQVFNKAKRGATAVVGTWGVPAALFQRVVAKAAEVNATKPRAPVAKTSAAPVSTKKVSDISV